jgi:hypothetical protein
VRSLATIALAAALLGGGCGSGQLVIDHKKAEGLARQIGAVKGSVKSASCPSDIKLKRGDDFDCDLVYADGTKRTITIHQLDDKGRIRTSAPDVH